MLKYTIKPDESIDSYVKHIKETKDKLANVSTKVDEDDLYIDLHPKWTSERV